MRSVSHFFKNPKDALIGFMSHTAPIWPDKTYLKIVYFLHMGKRLNLNNPKSFTEKLNWLKVNAKNSSYSDLVDKYSVKFHVERVLGTDENIIKTLGVWESFDEIDFSRLPNKFVLKTTNGGGNSSVVICRDKSKFDISDARQRLKLRNSKSAAIKYREYPYYKVIPRIIAEEYIETEDNELSDYKFFCFNGVPKLLFVGTERQKKGVDVKFDFFDTEFNHLPIRNGHDNANGMLSKPQNFDKMLEIAAKLSVGMPHVRVDLYNVNGKILFGELTFFHFGAFVPFEPDEWDDKIGEYLDLPSV